MSAATATNACRPQERTRSEAPLRREGRRVAGHRLERVGPILAPWQAKLATTIMANDPSIAISISEIALLCRLSLSHFVRAFSNTVGVTPYAWFMRQRIDRAEELLVNSSLPLAQIALECGFSDQAHFTKAFLKATGTTPARWRREMGGLFERVAGTAER